MSPQIQVVNKIAEHPTLLVAKDATGESLDAVLVFVKKGNSITEAQALIEGDLRSDRPEVLSYALPDTFDAEALGLYWDEVTYGG